MGNLITFQIELIQWLQSIGSWLTSPMEYLSLTGSEYFYLMIAPAIYWCWNTTLGLQTGLFLMVNANINSYIKILLHTARPFWISTSIKHLAFESSFGLPSGHAQNSIVFWGTIGAYFRKGWLWIILILFIFLVGISRLYLAVHFPHDVLAGWLVGTGLLWLLVSISSPVSAWITQRRLSTQIIVILVFSICLILFGFLSRLAVANFKLPDEWIANAALYFPEEDQINPVDITGIVSNAGAFFGLAAGACWLRAQGGFDASGTASQRLGRYLIGVVGVFLLWFGLGEIFPRGETWLYIILRFLRYGLTGLWVTALAPLVFIKIRLANHN